jgi:hypothetical protein
MFGKEQSGINRKIAIQQGLKTYESATPCKSCGSLIKYVSSYSCFKCSYEKGLKKLNNPELMAQYRTKEKRKDWISKNPIKVKKIKNRYRNNNKEKLDEYYRVNKDVWRKGQLKRLYGLTLDEYQDMLAKQNGKCAICAVHEDSVTRKFSVDHDHKTGKIRGLLCNNCNTGIGNLRDSIELLEQAIRYLR